MTLDENQIGNELVNTFNFKGIVARNELNNIKKFGFWIINTDLASSQGVHWICFYYSKNLLIFFDSFGVVPPEYVMNFDKSRGIKKIIFNNIALQKFKEINCGNYCVAFVKYNVKSLKSFREFINGFIGFKRFPLRNIV